MPYSLPFSAYFNCVPSLPRNVMVLESSNKYDESAAS